MNNFKIRILFRHYWKKRLSPRAATAEISKVEAKERSGKLLR